MIVTKGRKTGMIVYGSYAYHSLKIIAKGAALGIGLVAFIAAPNLALLAKPVLEYLQDKDKREWRKEQARLRQAIERLRLRRLVNLVERSDGIYLVLTKAGKEVLRKFEIHSISIERPSVWDRKWRLVFFDIPERYKNARNALRQKLLDIGFFQLQKSVLVFPYECQDEIDFIAQFFGADRFVQYAVCDDLGTNEVRLRKHFNFL